MSFGGALPSSERYCAKPLLLLREESLALTLLTIIEIINIICAVPVARVLVVLGCSFAVCSNMH